MIIGSEILSWDHIPVLVGVVETLSKRYSLQGFTLWPGEKWIPRKCDSNPDSVSCQMHGRDTAGKDESFCLCHMEVSDKVRSISWMSICPVGCVATKLVPAAMVMPTLHFMGELAVGRAAAPLVPNEASCTASSVGSSILLLEGGTGEYFNQGKTIWWALVTGFVTNFAWAMQECNRHDTTSVSWKHCHAVLLGLGYTAGTIGPFVMFWGLSVSAVLCCLSCCCCC